MPFSSNLLQRLYSWVTDRDAGIKILASKMDGEFDNVFDGVNQILQGTVPFSGAIKGISGTAGTPAFSFASDPDTGVYRKSANNMGMSVGGIEKVDINDTTTNLINTNLKHNGNTIYTEANLGILSSWTPTLYGSTTAGTTIYTTQVGSYYEIGRLATCVFTLGWSGFTGTGGVFIGGFPFTALNLDGDPKYGLSIAFYSGFILNGEVLGGNMENNSNYIRLTRNADGSNTLEHDKIASSGQIQGSITYII